MIVPEPVLLSALDGPLWATGILSETGKYKVNTLPAPAVLFTSTQPL
jgi:hypothetical protein